MNNSACIVTVDGKSYRIKKDELNLGPALERDDSRDKECYASYTKSNDSYVQSDAQNLLYSDPIFPKLSSEQKANMVNSAAIVQKLLDDGKIDSITYKQDASADEVVDIRGGRKKRRRKRRKSRKSMKNKKRSRYRKSRKRRTKRRYRKGGGKFSFFGNSECKELKRLNQECLKKQKEGVKLHPSCVAYSNKSRLLKRQGKCTSGGTKRKKSKKPRKSRKPRHRRKKNMKGGSTMNYSVINSGLKGNDARILGSHSYTRSENCGDGYNHFTRGQTKSLY